MAKTKATDPNAEKVKPGKQPKRGPKGSQSAAMNWLSSRIEGKRKENASTDYSKLHLLGRALVEARKSKRQKALDAPGQGKFNFDPGTHQKGSRRKQRATPRRREGEGGRRDIDKPKDTRHQGFDSKDHGTRSEDVARRASDAAVTQAASVAGAKRSVGGKSPERVFAAMHFNKIAGAAFKQGVKPIRFKNRTDRARKQNPHTATSPID